MESIPQQGINEGSEGFCKEIDLAARVQVWKQVVMVNGRGDFWKESGKSVPWKRIEWQRNEEWSRKTKMKHRPPSKEWKKRTIVDDRENFLKKISRNQSLHMESRRRRVARGYFWKDIWKSIPLERNEEGSSCSKGMNGDRKAFGEEIDQAVPPVKVWYDRARRDGRGEFGNL